MTRAASLGGQFKVRQALNQSNLLDVDEGERTCNKSNVLKIVLLWDPLNFTGNAQFDLDISISGWTRVEQEGPTPLCWDPVP